MESKLVETNKQVGELVHAILESAFGAGRAARVMEKSGKIDLKGIPKADQANFASACCVYALYDKAAAFYELSGLTHFMSKTIFRQTLNELKKASNSDEATLLSKHGRAFCQNLDSIGSILSEIHKDLRLDKRVIVQLRNCYPISTERVEDGVFIQSHSALNSEYHFYQIESSRVADRLNPSLLYLFALLNFALSKHVSHQDRARNVEPKEKPFSKTIHSFVLINQEWEERIWETKRQFSLNALERFEAMGIKVLKLEKLVTEGEVDSIKSGHHRQGKIETPDPSAFNMRDQQNLKIYN